MRSELIIVKVFCLAGVLPVSSVGSVVIKEENKTAISYYLKATKESNEDIENECMIHGMELECLKLRSNTLHAKFVRFSRTKDLQKLRFYVYEKRLRRMK